MDSALGIMKDGETKAATAKSCSGTIESSEDNGRSTATATTVTSHEKSTESPVCGNKRVLCSISRCRSTSVDENNGSGKRSNTRSPEPFTNSRKPKSTDDEEKQRQPFMAPSSHLNANSNHTEAALQGVLSDPELLERSMRRASIQPSREVEVDNDVSGEGIASNGRVVEHFGADTPLWRPSTDEHKSAEEVLRGKVVVLYFSAQWCPPCRRFTPLLKTIYQNLRQRTDIEDFEFVYCSMDNWTTEYKCYASQMPWWCLPHQSPVIDRLKTIYKTEGIPHLCVIDKDGELLCGDAVNEAMEDTVGARFPWRCPNAIEEILPDSYIMGTNDTTTYHSIADLDSKYLILYFGAGWCPRSTAFTKKVVRAYRALKRTRDDFEILYVSSDRDRRAFKETFGQMPFGAIPFGDRYAKNKVAHFLGVKGIPALMIFGPRPVRGGENNRQNRPLINRNIREVFERGDHMREFPYHPDSYGDINRVTADINGHVFAIVFHEAGDDHDQDEIKEAMQAASQRYANQFDDDVMKPIKFCWAFCFSGLCESLRSVLRLGHPKDTPTMILLDIPGSGSYHLCPETISENITADSILSFIKSPGPRIQI